MMEWLHKPMMQWNIIDVFIYIGIVLGALLLVLGVLKGSD
jgi:hypothetical protein